MLWPLCALMLLAWAFHWRTFGLQELGQDGYLSVDLGAGSITGMLVFLARDVHPPLFFALLHGLFAVGGVRYPVAKFLPVAATQLALPVAFCVARRLAGTSVAWWATVLLLTSVPLLLLAPTVRPFTLGLLCSLLSLLLTLRLVCRSGSKGNALSVALALVTAAALLTWYLHLFFLLLEAALLWRRWPEPGSSEQGNASGSQGFAPPAAKQAEFQISSGGSAQLGDARHRGLLALATGAVLAAPWYLYVLPGVLGKLTQGATVTQGTPQLPTPSVVFNGLTQALMGHIGVWPAITTAAWGMALALGLWRCRRSVASALPALSRHALIGGLALGTLEVGVILARWQHPDAAGRYLLGLLPFTTVLQALALPAGRWESPGKVRPAQRGIQGVAFAAVTLALAGQLSWYVGLLAIPPHNYEIDGESNFLVAHLQTGDGILFSDHGRRGQFLLNRRFSHDRPTAVVQTSGDRYLGDTAAQANAAVAKLVARAGRVWYMNTEPQPDREPLGMEALAARAAIVSVSHAGDSDISLFVTRPPDQFRRINATLGGAVTLQSAAYTGAAVPDQAVRVDLVWRDVQPLPAQYSVFVHLDNAAGKLVAQHDGVPDAGLQPTPTWRPGEVVNDRHGFIVPANLAPGAYLLHAGIYQVNGARLALPDGQNQITLGTVQVSR